ncbi:MAG: hypothetical protein HY840_00985 [Bacteroidetes bacterium]|nr:hypothetical protein [Bacteroidota bacterium]
MLYKDFYSELGKLLYAVADIDGVITPAEKKALHEIVRKELVPAEKHKDEFGTDTAYYAEMEFDYLDEEIGDAEAAFNSFIDFVEEHHMAFDEKMKKVCLHVAKEIANAYHKTNKKEKALIEKLKERIKK